MCSNGSDVTDNLLDARTPELDFDSIESVKMSLLLLLDKDAVSVTRSERDQLHAVHGPIERTEIISERISKFDFTQHPKIVRCCFELSVIFVRRENVEDLCNGS